MKYRSRSSIDAENLMTPSDDDMYQVSIQYPSLWEIDLNAES